MRRFPTDRLFTPVKNTFIHIESDGSDDSHGTRSAPAAIEAHSDQNDDAWHDFFIGDAPREVGIQTVTAFEVDDTPLEAKAHKV